uniref:Uncharacterized protein n=1 Tax=Rhizophora mucronata TaxID=61149 RepID=A0A2P2NV00_RHIMU
MNLLGSCHGFLPFQSQITSPYAGIQPPTSCSFGFSLNALLPSRGTSMEAEECDDDH